MSTPDVRSAVARALLFERPDDLVDGVKSAVIAELEALDPTVVIKKTDYFNHSYVPDLVMSWKDSGNSSTRDVFLRYSLRAATAGRDIEALAGFGPVLLALREEDDPAVLAEAQDEVDEAPRLLLTDIPALEDLAGRPSTRRQESMDLTVGPTAGRPPHQWTEQPLLELVRGNVMRGGRGLIVSGTAAHLAAQSLSTPDIEDEVARLESFTSIVRDVFVSDAATRLERAAQILYIGLTGDTVALEAARRMDSDVPSDIIAGRLSDSELSVLVPYLLGRDDATDDPLFWSHLGSMLSLDRLESMHDQLADLNLTRLVVPNLGTWRATRVSASFNVDALEEGGREEFGWRMHGRMLCLAAGSWLVHVTTDRRKLPGRPDTRPARWEDLAPTLRRFSLSAVTLHGLIRRVRVNAERADDVFADVDTITATLDDSFRVPVVEVRTGDGDEQAMIEADLTKMTADAPRGASARDLTRVALEILAHERSDRIELDVG